MSRLSYDDEMESVRRVEQKQHRRSIPMIDEWLKTHGYPSYRDPASVDLSAVHPDNRALMFALSPHERSRKQGCRMQSSIGDVDEFYNTARFAHDGTERGHIHMGRFTRGPKRVPYDGDGPHWPFVVWGGANGGDLYMPPRFASEFYEGWG